MGIVNISQFGIGLFSLSQFTISVFVIAQFGLYVNEGYRQVVKDLSLLLEL